MKNKNMIEVSSATLASPKLLCQMCSSW